MGWRSRVQQNWIPQPFYGSHCPIFSLSVTSRLQYRQRLLLAEVTLALFPYAPCLLSVVSDLAINGSSHGNIPSEMRAIEA